MQIERGGEPFAHIRRKTQQITRYSKVEENINEGDTRELAEEEHENENKSLSKASDRERNSGYLEDGGDADDVGDGRRGSETRSSWWLWSSRLRS